MRLSGLLPQTLIRHSSGPPDCEIDGLAYDSRQVAPGTAFFALRGATVDGHSFIAEALRRGARAVISEVSSPLPAGVTGIVVADSRLALALAAARFYAAPSPGIPVVGVTGTNGKTTVSYLLEAILQEARAPPGRLRHHQLPLRVPGAAGLPHHPGISRPAAPDRRLLRMPAPMPW